jgi:hypothetical protein
MIVQRYRLEAAPLNNLKLGGIYIVDDIDRDTRPFEAIYCGAETQREITYLVFFDLDHRGLYEFPRDSSWRQFCVYFAARGWRGRVS